MVNNELFENEFFIGIHNEGESYNLDEEVSKVKSFMEENLEEGKEYFFVFVNHTNDVGVVEIGRNDLYIGDTYMKMARLISFYEYEKNVAVEVYSFIDNECVSVKTKYFNGACYESYAGCNPYPYDLRLNVHKLADIGCTIHY